MPLLRIIISFAFSNLTFITIRLFVRDLIQDERVLLYVVAEEGNYFLFIKWYQTTLKIKHPT